MKNPSAISSATPVPQPIGIGMQPMQPPPRARRPERFEYQRKGTR